MEKVILKPGDSVIHPSLGEGTVTVADEEFCTVKFESREAMFRLPDAFEEGFLSSEDAEIIEDDEDIDDEEVAEEKDELLGAVQARVVSSGQNEDSPAKKGISSTQVIVAIGLGIFLIPIGYLLFSIGKENFDEFLGGIFTIVGIVLMCSPLIAFIPGLDKVSTHYTGSSIGSSGIDTSIDPAGRKSSWRFWRWTNVRP